MNESYHIEYVEKEREIVSKIMWEGIQQNMKEQVGDPEPHRLCFALFSADKEIVGGVVGDQYWDWIYIDLLWVQEELRGCGYGERLLAQLENEARNRGVRYIYLNTFSFQAPGFYQQYGYQLFGKLEDFPTGNQRYFFTKKL